MPVFKYKTFEEARDNLFVHSPDEKYYRLLRDFFDLWFRLKKPTVEEKLVKYKNIFEKNSLG